MGLEKYVLNGNPICCAANVVSGEHYRISMLTTALVRLEYSENGEFEVPDSFTGIPLELQSPCIFFKNQSITDFIAEWNEIKKLNVQNSALKNNVYSTWKSGSITENKSKLKKYNFKEKRFFQKILAESFLSDYSSSSYENWPILLPDDADLLKEYIESGNYTLDLDSQDQSILLDWFKKIGHSSI